MKKILILLFSLFFLSSPSVFADDISDFEIEGISIGDSLLDYMTEDEIFEEIERTKGRFSYLKEPDKYVMIKLIKDFSTYDGMVLIIKKNSTNKYITDKNDKNEKYTILSIRGTKKYIDDFDGCIQERDEIVEILSSMFLNTRKIEQINEHTADPSGNSLVDIFAFDFDSGDHIDLYCENLEKTFRIKGNWNEGLNVAIRSSEIVNWLQNKK